MIKLTILYDNHSYREDFSWGWGFSVLIEKGKKKILFDFGEAWEPLKKNMELTDTFPMEIDIAVLSHDHWDHNGGLKDLAISNEKAGFFVPSDFHGYEVFEMPYFEGKSGERKVVFVKDAMEIYPGIYSSGSLPSDVGVMEQALGISTNKGIIAIVGCSHPGVDKLVESLERFGSVFAVMGGFHGFNRLDYLRKFDIVVPTHCTKKREEIMEMLGSAALPGGSGFSLEI